MKEKVISIQREENTNNRGIFGNLERKKCIVTFLENNIEKYKTCYLDTTEILDYISEYMTYLNEKLARTTRKSLEGTWKKRLKYNLIASPVYLIAFIMFFASLTPNPVLELLIQSLGIIVGGASAAYVNDRKKYIPPKIINELKDLENLLKESQELEIDAKEAVKNKGDDDLKRAKIVSDAMRRKNEMRNRARNLELENFRNRVERKLHDEKMKEYRGGRPEPEIPEYLRRKR